MKINYVSFACLVLWVTSATVGQNHEISVQADSCERRFSSDHAKQDLELLVACLNKLHPALDRHRPMKEVESDFQHLVSLTDSKTEISETELVQLTSKLVAKIGCSHTSVRPGAKATEKCLTSKTLLPLGVEVLNARLLVFHDLSEEQQVGENVELISINGKSCSEIVAVMNQNKSLDGLMTAGRPRKTLKPFLWGYRWAFGPAEEFELVIRSGTRQRTITVNAIDYATRQNRRSKRYPDFDPNENAVSLKIRGNGISVLRVASFYKDGGNGSWFKDKFADIIQEIQRAKTKDLIIDVRDNPGGWDESPADLFAHIANKPFKTYRKLSHSAKTIPKGCQIDLDMEDFSEYSKPPSESIERVKEEGGIGDLLNHYTSTHPLNGATWELPDMRYEGRVWILINRYSGSSGSEFPGYVKFHQRGVLIGEETGGGYAGCNAGILPEITLPNSGIRVRIPLIRYDMGFEMPKEDASRGVRPDVIVQPKLNDLNNKTDATMTRALKLIDDARR